MKYRKKPIVIEAEQWFENGDHSEDNCKVFFDSETGQHFKSEGKIVKYYRHPDVHGDSDCISSIPCKHIMHHHGWIDTPEGGHNVCPGDWIIKGIKGEFYPIKNDIFLESYEKVE